MKENPLSFHLNLKPEDFLPATEEEKQSQVIMIIFHDSASTIPI